MYTEECKRRCTILSPPLSSPFFHPFFHYVTHYFPFQGCRTSLNCCKKDPDLEVEVEFITDGEMVCFIFFSLLFSFLFFSLVFLSFFFLLFLFFSSLLFSSSSSTLTSNLRLPSSLRSHEELSFFHSYLSFNFFFLVFLFLQQLIYTYRRIHKRGRRKGNTKGY